MKTYIIICLAVVACVAVQYAEAFFLEDLVFFPSEKAKRDLDMEEFLRDGDREQSEKRSLNRQRRAFREANSDLLERHRRFSAEDAADGDEYFECRSMELETMRRKRSASDVKNCPRAMKINLYIDPAFSDVSEGRIDVVSSSLNYVMAQQFLIVYSSADAALVVKLCPHAAAPLGFCEEERGEMCLVQNGKDKTPIYLIYHELLHIYDLVHTHQEKHHEGFPAELFIQTECIPSGADMNYVQMDTYYRTCGNPNTVSVISYRNLNPQCEAIKTSISATIPAALLASNKEADVFDIQKANEGKVAAGCQTCYSKSNSFAVGPGCQRAYYEPDVEVKRMDLTQTSRIEVSRNILEVIQCSKKYFLFGSVRWTAGSSMTALCRDDRFSVLEMSCGCMQYHFYGCENNLTGYKSVNAKIDSDGVLLIDASSATLDTDSLTLDLWCSDAEPSTTDTSQWNYAA